MIFLNSGYFTTTEVYVFTGGEWKRAEIWCYTGEEWRVESGE